REQSGRQAAEGRPPPPAFGRAGRIGGGTAARTDAQGDRRRVHRPRQQGGVRADQARYRRRQVLRSDVGPAGRRPGHNGTVQFGARHGGRRSGEGRQQEQEVNKFLDSAAIALAAIWSAKLRSFMTVLGNIVAVTSIIAVVSLIQGLNASVKSAILNQAGADSFNIQQFPITRSDEAFDKVRNNPRVTIADARAVRRYTQLAAAVMADATSNGRITFRDKSIDQTRVQGVTSEYVDFSSFDAERGRLMSPTEVETARPVAVIGSQTAERVFGADIDPLDK